MNVAELQHFPAQAAHYCLDCHSVSNSGSICPACGCAGTNLMPLAPILDRVTEPVGAKA